MELRLPQVDFDFEVKRIVGFIRRIVGESGANGVVIGLSGGVDSSVVATLCVKALGKENVLGVLMPTGFTPRQDLDDALWLADWLGIKTERIDIDGICMSFFEALGCTNEAEFKIPKANIRARVRMIILYYFANLRNLLVAGTGDKSEILIGYYTKYGDGGVDFLPIGHLYKSQVRDLAKFMGLPDSIAYKPSSPQLYPGHKATNEIPADYNVLDLILCGLFDYRLSPNEIAKKLGISPKIVEETLRKHKLSMHKRRMPSIIA